MGEVQRKGQGAADCGRGPQTKPADPSFYRKFNSHARLSRDLPCIYPFQANNYLLRSAPASGSSFAAAARGSYRRTRSTTTGRWSEAREAGALAESTSQVSSTRT